VAITWSMGLEESYHHGEGVLRTTGSLEQIYSERQRFSVYWLLRRQRRRTLALPVSIWQAAMTGNTAAVEEHVGAGTDLKSKEDSGGSTPLILAAIWGEKRLRNRSLMPVQISIRNTTPAEHLFIRRASFVIRGLWSYC